MRRKEIKYNYAIFKILGHITQGTNLVAIHNFEKETITLYNMYNKKIQSIDFDELIKTFFEKDNYKQLPLTINELAQFITSLPSNYKQITENGIKGEIDKCLEKKQNSKKKK